MNYKKVKFELGLEDCELVTRRGEKVIFAGHNSNALPRHRIAGWVGEVLMSWYEDGSFQLSREEHDYDLFALVESQIGFINLHGDSLGEWADERIYDYRAIAEENGKLSPTYYKTIEIEL
jgi:hypothetical protein